MENIGIYEKLIESYSEENLNRITRKLIEFYKQKNFVAIREIANKISKYETIDEESDMKIFSRLIFLYHPDKGAFIRKEIENLHKNSDKKSLLKYSHIFILNEFDISDKLIDSEIDYNPEYSWENSESEYSTHFEEDELNTEKRYFTEEKENSFYNAVKLRMYGDLDREFPTYYLEDIDVFELANNGIETLDGVEYCKHAVIIDLSDNNITDISELWSLERIEELYLANNQIGYIDSLSNLLKLRIIDLSGNQIDDISPLLELENLEYVNLIGNRIPKEQIEELRKKSIIVIY